MIKDVWFREQVQSVIKSILRAMLNSGRSEDYRQAAIDFAMSLSDVFGIGVVDECGDLRDIGRLGLRAANRADGNSSVLPDANIS